MDLLFKINMTELRPTPTKAFLATRPNTQLDLRSVVCIVDGVMRANFVCGSQHLAPELIRCLQQIFDGSFSTVSSSPLESSPGPLVSKERIAELRAMPYELYLQSPEWVRTRQQAIERARFRCQACNGAVNLQVHHRDYENLGCELPSDLLVLCEGCHEVFHENRRLVRP